MTGRGGALVALAEVGDGRDQHAIGGGEIGHALPQLQALLRHLCHLRTPLLVRVSVNPTLPYPDPF